MKNYRFSIGARLALNFSLFLIIILILSTMYIFQISRMASVFRDFYDHPYTVSNKVLVIESNIIRMHRAMKDVAISESQAEIYKFSNAVDRLEDEIINDFTLVYDRYLGDRKEIDEAFDAFLDWREIRHEVINLKLAGENSASAAVTQDRGARHVELLEKKIYTLVDFAEKKAASFSIEADNTRRTVFNSLWLFCSIALLCGIIITITATRSITSPLMRIVEWIRVISSGKLSNDISLSRNDEIGTLADSCRMMQQNLRYKSEIAKKIAGGDFSERVDVENSDDEVAISINQIAENYSLITEENELQNWLKTGQNLLNKDIQGVSDAQEFSHKVISRLCSHLDAQIGGVYIADVGKSELRLSGSYAFYLQENTNNIIPFGEGIGGQCAVEKQIISITKLPDGFFRIGAGSGECAPANVIAVPILHEGEISAVVELGAVREFTERELEFLRLTSDIIGYGLNSVLSKVETEKLLRETQRQSEELGVQQEELRQTNYELQEQAHALKDSEARLQIQQEELRVTNEELEQKTEQLQLQTDTLKQKNEEIDRVMNEISVKAEDLKRSSGYKSEFMANMSHELRTPLNSIIILSRLLSQDDDDNLSEKEKEFAETIHSSGSDLLHLINEILDLSKIEAGKMEIISETFSIKQLLGTLNRCFQQTADEKGLDFSMKVEKDVPSQISSDLKRVEQVLKNLLSNSFKFTERGGISLVVSREDSGMICFSVSDTGIGIPEDKQKIIFDAFQQADGTTNRQYGGTGLGLSISLELARLLGGDIKMESEKDRGSDFSLSLPDTGEVVSSDKKEFFSASVLPPRNIENIIDDRNSIGEGDRSILIIEDDPVFAKVLLDFARKKEFKGIIASDGESGLHFADYYSPSAILLDIGLPGIDGWEVMDRLKSSDATRYIPVHFLTAGDDSMGALGHGAVGFIQKPVDLEKLDEVFGDISSILTGKIKKLLIVEDDNKERKSIIELLKGKNLEITEASSGKQAIELISREEFDCIVLDLVLKDISGFEILSHLRDSGAERVPVVVYTGKDLKEHERLELLKYSESVILKSARSPERLLEETALFLHRVESELPETMKRDIQMVRKQNFSLKNKDILLVDDDMRNVFALSSVLEKNGMHIQVGKNGREAIAKLESADNVDLVLMDIMMPEMDGYEAIKIIRSKPGFQRLPIIALTANAMKGDRNKCIDAGASDYLSKPVEIGKLLSLLRVWLHG